MDCMKCGRQTQDQNVFCSDCLAEMEKHPVKPDTPVILPHRKSKDRRIHQKKQPKAEEMITQLQLKIKRLWICIAVLSVLFTAALGCIGVMLYHQLEAPEFGFNYSTFSSTETTGETTN